MAKLPRNVRGAGGNTARTHSTETSRRCCPTQEAGGGSRKTRRFRIQRSRHQLFSAIGIKVQSSRPNHFLSPECLLPELNFLTLYSASLCVSPPSPIESSPQTLDFKHKLSQLPSEPCRDRRDYPSVFQSFISLLILLLILTAP